MASIDLGDVVIVFPSDEALAAFEEAIENGGDFWECVAAFGGVATKIDDEPETGLKP